MGAPAAAAAAAATVFAIVCLVVPGARADTMTVTSDGAPTLTIHGTHYAAANNSFHIVNASAFFASDEEALGASFPASARGAVVFIASTVTMNAGRLAAGCQRVACAAIAFYGEQSRPLVDLPTWTYRTRATPFTSVPVFVLEYSAGNALPNAIRALARPAITLESSPDPNPNEIGLRRPVVVAFGVGVVVVCVAEFLYAVYKLVGFAVDNDGRLRRVPRNALCIFLLQMGAAVLRGIWFANISLCNGIALSYFAFRLTWSGFVPMHFASSLFIGLAVWDAYVATASKGGRSTLLNVFAALAVVTFAVDLLLTVVQGVEQLEFLATSLLDALYVVMYIPANVVFIRYGRKVSAMLLANAESMHGDPTTIRTRQRFANRIALNGAFGLLYAANIIVTGVLNTTMADYSDYQIVFAQSCAMQSVDGLLILSAFTPTNPITDRLCDHVSSLLLSIRKRSQVSPVPTPNP
ncbi:Intimal thickness related receptor IRP domain-containing protein [Plasmodiophora brassicae]